MQIPKLHTYGKLSRPVLNQVLERHGSKHFRVGLASMQGYRSEMEDAHSVKCSLPNKESLGFFAVFDGHGGPEASAFCSRAFPEFISQLQEVTPSSVAEAVMAVDEKFLSERQADDGCTATFVIASCDTKENVIKLAIGNLGDSRSILVKSTGEKVYVTKDHKPTQPIERARIERAHGSVWRKRVNGNLNLSRAIGDKVFKESEDLPPEEQQVIALPDVNFIVAAPNDYLIICCDGLFEAMSNQDLVTLVHSKMQETTDLAIVCSQVLMNAVERSGDNMTMMIVQLGVDGSDYGRKSEFLPGPYFKGAEDFEMAYKADVERFGWSVQEVLEKANVLQV